MYSCKHHSNALRGAGHCFSERASLRPHRSWALVGLSILRWCRPAATAAQQFATKLALRVGGFRPRTNQGRLKAAVTPAACRSHGPSPTAAPAPAHRRAVRRIPTAQPDMLIVIPAGASESTLRQGPDRGPRAGHRWRRRWVPSRSTLGSCAALDGVTPPPAALLNRRGGKTGLNCLFDSSEPARATAGRPGRRNAAPLTRHRLTSSSRARVSTGRQRARNPRSGRARRGE